MLHRFIWVIVLVVAGCTQHPAAVNIRCAADQTDYTPIIRDILSEHPDGNLTLRFEEGIYDFYPEKAFGEYLCISNNDNGYKHCAFYLNGVQHVQIEGQGENTRLRFHGGLVPFRITDSQQITFCGFSIDCDVPFVFEGQVVANNPAEPSITLRVHHDNPFKVRDGQLHFYGYDWDSTLGENILFDPVSRSPYYSSERYEHDASQSLQARIIDDSLVVLSGYKARELPPIGSIYTDKGPHSTNRLYPGFALSHATDITLKDIAIYKTGGMALIAERCRNITCDNYRVRTEPNSGRMISASADATHFIGCTGYIHLRNCLFESMLDDATNIHGTYMKVADRLSPHCVGLTFGHFQQEGYDLAEPNDSLIFVDRADLREVGRGKVQSFRHVNDNYYIAETDFDLRSIPDSVQLAVENGERGANVEITNCKVCHNRARSLLISTSGDVAIEHCDLSSMMAGIRICGDANYWFESGRTRSISIQNNRFRNLATGGWSPQAVLQIDPVIHTGKRGNYYYHNQIFFEGNEVQTFDDQIIYALSVDSLVIRNNRFVDSKSFAPRYSGLSVIDVQHCRSITIEANDFSHWKKPTSISILACFNCHIEGDMLPPIVENPNKYFYEN